MNSTATLSASFLSISAEAPAMLLDGTSLRSAKREASKACRAHGPRFSASLRADVNGVSTIVSYFDGAKWRDLYSAEFLASRYGISV